MGTMKVSELTGAKLDYWVATSAWRMCPSI